ncbi:MAG: DUF3147 family protein [Sandaracinobacteroides sp.]
MFWVKAMISGLLIAAASELGRRNAAFGGLVGSLPLVSLLAMIWLWRGGSSTQHLASYSFATFWFVLPSLPMFLLMPALFRMGWSFWPTILAGAALTVALYLATLWLLPRFGVNL